MTYIKTLVVSILLFTTHAWAVDQLHVSDMCEKLENNKSRRIIDFATFDYQGRRQTMEDAYFNSVGIGPDNRFSFFGLYDGHGGDYVAKYASRVLHDIIFDNVFALTVSQAIKQGFLETHARVRHATTTGSTALVAIKYGARLWIGWVGDSRAVMGHSNGSFTALSQDHKPNRPDEQARIESLGGFVTEGTVARVNGILAVSRALGDKDLNPPITSEPEIAEYYLSDADMFLILACDGVWDVLSSEQAVQIVGKSLRQNPTSAAVAARKLGIAAYNAGSTDNITVTVIAFE